MSTSRDAFDRRRRARGTPHGEPSRAELVSRIMAAYRDRPGLSLHLHDAVQLFGLTPRTCQVLFDDLVSQGRLHRRRGGEYTAPERR
jgi:hypothetical protein